MNICINKIKVRIDRNQSVLRLDRDEHISEYGSCTLWLVVWEVDRSQVNPILRVNNFLHNSEMICKSGRVKEGLGRVKSSPGWVVQAADDENTQSHKEQSTQWQREALWIYWQWWWPMVHPEGNLGNKKFVLCRDLHYKILSTELWRFIDFPPKCLGSCNWIFSWLLGIFQFQVTKSIFKLSKEKRKAFLAHLNEG